MSEKVLSKSPLSIEFKLYLSQLDAPKSKSQFKSSLFLFLKTEKSQELGLSEQQGGKM